MIACDDFPVSCYFLVVNVYPLYYFGARCIFQSGLSTIQQEFAPDLPRSMAFRSWWTALVNQPPFDNVIACFHELQSVITSSFININPQNLQKVTPVMTAITTISIITINNIAKHFPVQALGLAQQIWIINEECV